MANKDAGGELFMLVEQDLGFAHISDAIEGLPRERVLAIARGSLKHVEIAAVKLKRFIKKHEQLAARRPMTKYWVVRYRRYWSDKWSERVFGSKAEANEFARHYQYDTDNNGEVVVRKFVEVKETK